MRNSTQNFWRFKKPLAFDIYKKKHQFLHDYDEKIPFVTKEGKLWKNFDS